MRIGTNNFKSISAAVRYYRVFGGESKDSAEKVVSEKIRDKNIEIGEPPIKMGQKLLLDIRDGRYFIED